MRYHILESGSKGNATLVVSESGILLIDDGLCKRDLVNKLSEVGYAIEDLDGILITHGHHDHISGVKFLPISKIYATKQTFNAIKKTHKLDDIELSKGHELAPFKVLKIKDYEVEVLPTSHDISGSCGFKISDGKETLSYITDTGFVYEKVLTHITDSTYFIFESNHDIRMLLDTDRPQSLKDRILGDKGHLSNEDCALYLSEVIGSNTKEIVLAHLSLEANKPEKALNAFLKIMEKRGVSLENILFRCASQYETVSGGNMIYA